MVAEHVLLGSFAMVHFPFFYPDCYLLTEETSLVLVYSMSRCYEEEKRNLEWVLAASSYDVMFFLPTLFYLSDLGT